MENNTFDNQPLNEPDLDSEIINELETNNTHSDESKKRTHFMVATITCSILILTIFIAAMMYTMHQNTIKQEKLQATERVDYLCDELYEINGFYSDLEFEKAKDKLVEIDKLIENNGISEEKGAKRDDVKSYIYDLKTFQYISNNVHSLDKTTLKKVDSEIKKLKNKKVIAKLSDYYPTLENHARNIIWTNVTKKCQDYVLAENADFCEINSILIYDEYNGSTIHPANPGYFANTYGVNGQFFTNEKFYSFNKIEEKISEDVWNSISNNGKRAIIVNYFPGYWSTSIWWYLGYDISARYANGSILYEVTKYSSGNRQYLGQLTLDEVFNTTISLS